MLITCTTQFPWLPDKEEATNLEETTSASMEYLKQLNIFTPKIKA